jgi:hypothetical protein
MSCIEGSNPSASANQRSKEAGPAGPVFISVHAAPIRFN